MILEESCKKILSDVQKLESFDAVEEMVDRLEEHRLKILEVHLTLRDAVEKLKTLGEPYCTLPHVGSAPEEIRKYAQSVEKDDTKLRKEFVVIKKSIDDVVREAQENLEIGYQNLIRTIPRIDSIDPHLKLIETIPGHRDYVTDVRGGFLKIRAYGNVRTLSSEALKEFMKLGGELQHMIDNIPVKEFPENVRKFLEATRKAEGATYDLLTTDVEEWLKAKNMMNRIRLKLST